MRAYISGLLEGAGYEVEASKDGEAALAACRLKLPDLILSDVMMPGMDGFTLLQHLRAEEHTAVVPVILISARAGEEARIEGLAAGADDYLVKPFGARELVARVDGAVRLSRVRHEAARRQHQVLAEANALLERSNQALKDFASIASHDLQEPLRKVTTFGSMLKQKYGDSLGEQGKGYLEKVLDANQRMQSLLTALLEYSRLSTKAAPFEEVALTKVIQEVLADLEVRINQTGGEVCVGELPVIQADPTQMRQLLQNLLGNALKFHKEGEKPIVKVSSIPASNGLAQIIVEDNGIGFDEQYLVEIFAPFQRLHGKSSQYEGTGMGLAICKKIAERHGGNITAQSEPNRGSVFTVRLPQKQRNTESLG
jgi:light-regulated signal transduction histidine kinase (bacteriophytochrome)